MSDLVAPSAAIRRFGESAARMAKEVTTAATTEQASSVAAAETVFGTIGADFVRAFTEAQANHVASAKKLAGVYSKTASTAHASAAAYEATDGGSAAVFTPNGLPA